MTRLPRLALVAAAGALLVAPAAASATRPRVPGRPQVKVLGFSTFPRLGIPPIQARPGRTLTQCYDGYNGQREMNVVWQGWGIPKGTRMGLAFWGGGATLGTNLETSDADAMRPGTGGFAWRHKKAEKVQAPYGYTFAGGPFGPVNLDGTWTVKILIKGRVVVRKQVTVACG